MKSTEPAVVVKQTFDVPLERVWEAITNPDQMREWYFDDIPDFKPEVGFKTEFNVNSEGRNFLHQWTITEVVRGEKIAYDWRFEQYPGVGLVIFELSSDGASTTLTLTNRVEEDFPDDIPEFRRESCVGGWEYFIKENLKDYLGKTH